MIKQKIFIIVSTLIFSAFIIGCGGDNGDDNNNNSVIPKELCKNFPPLPGESWTYTVIWKGDETYTEIETHIAQKVDKLIGGHVVYLEYITTELRDIDQPSLEPPGSGEYIGCDPRVGKFLVATTSYSVLPPDPTGETVEIQLVDQPDPPIPRYFFTYGTEVGTTKTLEDDEEGTLKAEVASYENVKVPYGNFSKVMKVKVTVYDEQIGGSYPIYYWIHPEIGKIKEDDTAPITYGKILELMNYNPPGTKVNQSPPGNNNVKLKTKGENLFDPKLPY